MSGINRREFLKSGLVAAAALAPVSSQAQLFSRPLRAGRSAAPRKIIIAGAGLAGLVAAHELKRLGHGVTIIEARRRPGGRVLTLREPFDEGLYAEAGATRIHSSHDLTMKYIKAFGLSLVPFYPSAGHFIRLNRNERLEADWEKFSDDVRRTIDLEKSQNWYRIQGGNELLPLAFAKRLEGSILYNSPVVAIEQDQRSVSLLFSRGGSTEKITGDYLICTIPFSILRRVRVSPQFTAPKRKIIEELSHDSASRVFLQVRERFWQTQKANGYAIVDQTIEIWDSTFNQPGARGILQTYLRGSNSENLRKLPEQERIKATIERMERVFPGTRNRFEKGVSKCWSEDEWALGAWTHPDEESFQIIARPEGRVHFAGDHASHRPSWMQGALESGLRVLEEINEAAQGARASTSA